jgi:anti-sigma B factor antagonist
MIRAIPSGDEHGDSPAEPDAPFLVDVRRHGAAVVVGPQGDVDMATVTAVRHAIAEAGAAPTVVLDLRGVDFLDTSGLQLVLEQRRRAEAEGFRLVLVRGHGGVQRLFDIAGLTPALTFVDDPAEALGR